jgi:hypothetical protein
MNVADNTVLDCNNHHHQLQQPTIADESSEEEWTYTTTRMNAKQQQQFQQKNVGVKLHLDFNTLAVTAATTKIDNSINNKILDDTLVVNDEVIGLQQVEDQGSKKINSNSDDECTNSKDSIQRLIREVSYMHFKPFLLSRKNV